VIWSTLVVCSATCWCQRESTGRFGSLIHLIDCGPIHGRGHSPTCETWQASSRGLRQRTANSRQLHQHDLLMGNAISRCNSDDPISRYSAQCGSVRQDQVCQTSTPDQRRCSVTCRLGLSQIDKLNSHPVTLRREYHVHLFHGSSPASTHRLSVVFAHFRQINHPLLHAVSQKHSGAGGRRRICARSA
jgi:hypothetical protein